MATSRQADPARAFDALDAATRAIAGVMSVDESLQVIVDEVRPLVGARYAALGIVDHNGVIEMFFTSGIDAETRALLGAPPQGHGILGVIVRENRSLRIADITKDPRRYGFPPHHPPMTSLLGVPIGIKGRSIGNLYLTDKVDGAPFSESDESIVEAFARHAAIAIENARLHEQVQRLAVVDERERIGRDLHDGIIQSIYAIGLSLEDVPDLMDEDPGEVVRRVERAIDGLHLTIRDIRNFIMGLRPELLSGVDLAAGLAAVTEGFRHDSLIDLEFDAQGIDFDLGPSVNPHVLAIVNEALSNVSRHSGATRASVDVATSDDGSVTVVVRDNGTGFDPIAPAVVGHQGLDNMRSRAADIGATLDIEGSEGGTTLTLVLPPGSTPGHQSETRP